MADDIKKLMRVATDSNTNTNTVPSPFAERNKTTGKLYCRICKRTVGDDALWIPHAASKLHRDNVELVNKQPSVSSTSTTTTTTSKSVNSIPTSSIISTSSINTTLTSNIPSSSSSTVLSTNKLSTNIISPVNTSIVSSSSVSNNNISSTSLSSTSSSLLPTDFYDKSTHSLTSTSKHIPTATEKNLLNVSSSTAYSTSLSSNRRPTDNTKTINSSSTSSALPVGFFDNAEADAKAHGLKLEDVTKANAANEFAEFMNWVQGINEEENQRQSTEETMYNQRSLLSEVENTLYQGRMDIIKLLKERKDQGITITDENDTTSSTKNTNSDITGTELLTTKSLLTMTDDTAVRIKPEDIINLVRNKKDNYYTAIQTTPATETDTQKRRKIESDSENNSIPSTTTNLLTTNIDDDDDDTLDSLLDWRRKRV